MQITQRPGPQQPVRPKEKKSSEGMAFPPNNRHHWDEGKANTVRRIRDLAIPLMFRCEDKGFENIPKDGNFIVGPTHQSMFDALLASRVPDNRPQGSMSDVNQFKGLLGGMLADLGSFPVDRYGEYEGNFPEPVAHAQEILNEGKNFIFYPEGRIFNTKVVQPLKTGVGRISVGSEVKYALPVAQHFAKDTKKRPLETLVGVGISAAAVAAGVMAGAGGGWQAAVAGGLTGLISGAALGAGAGFALSAKEEFAIKGSNAAKGAAIGALATSVAAATVGALAPSLAPAVVGTTSVLTGLVGLGATYHWTHRSIAHTVVAKPIEVQPYRDRAKASNDPKAEWKEALKLTADFHESLAATKSALTGKENPFKMDYEGNGWKKTEDGRWAKVDFSKETKEWEFIEPRQYQA